MKKKTKKCVVFFLCVAIVVGGVYMPKKNVSATQSKSENFNTNFNKTGNGAVDIVSAASAQLERTQGNLGYTEGWCADFVCDCAKVAGISSSVIPWNYSSRGGVSYLYDYMINNCGAKVVSSPQTGDIVFYRTSSYWAHVAIVTDSSGNSIHGNVTWCTSTGRDNGVSHVCTRRKNVYENAMQQTAVYVRPNYSAQSEPTKPSKPTLQWPTVNADSVTFTWNACANTDDYDLYIFNHSGENYKAVFDIKSTQYTMPGSEIPDGSYFFAVAATHNSSGNYTFSDQKHFIVINTRRIFLESENTAGHQPKIKTTVNDVNTGRGAGQIIIYTSDYRKATNTNYWGREVAVDKTGKVVATREYQDPNGLAIPDGGFVISMHAQNPYTYQINIGYYAAFNRTTRTLYIYADEFQYKLLTKTINREEVIGELSRLGLAGMRLNGWKMNGQLIDVNTTKLSEDTVLQADWVIDRIKGDADGNSSITAEDALAILKHVVGSETLTEVALESVDVDASKQITAEDALAVLKKVVGAIGSFDEIKVNP